MQTIRILPIFSILLVRNKEVYEHALYLGAHYLGPHTTPTPGAIRVTTLSKNNGIVIKFSQNYKCVTDGNNVNLSKNIDKGLIQMMNQLKEEQRLQLLEEQSLDNDLEEEEAIESETLQEQQEESETDLDQATESESSRQDLTKE